MTSIAYPDAESVDEITARYLLALPTAQMPVLYGFRYDGDCIHAECTTIDLTGVRRASEPNPIHRAAAQLRDVLGPEMFGFGFAFLVFADQLDGGPENRHIPACIRTAAHRFPTATDLIAATTMDATGRQWWAVAPRHIPGLDPVRIHLPAPERAAWRLSESLDTSVWTAALALDKANHTDLLRLHDHAAANPDRPS